MTDCRTMNHQDTMANSSADVYSSLDEDLSVDEDLLINDTHPSCSAKSVADRLLFPLQIHCL